MNVWKTAILLVVLTTGGAAHAHAQANPGNEAIVRSIFDNAWSKGSFESVEPLLAPSLQFHFRGSSRPMTPQQFQGMVSSWRTAMPDLRFTIEDVVSSGDRVAARVTFTGTHEKELMRMAPTGKAVKVTMMSFFRLADGKVTDMWEDYDEHGMRQQLSAPPTR